MHFFCNVKLYGYNFLNQWCEFLRNELPGKISIGVKIRESLDQDQTQPKLQLGGEKKNVCCTYTPTHHPNSMFLASLYFRLNNNWCVSTWMGGHVSTLWCCFSSAFYVKLWITVYVQIVGTRRF